ncbi:dTDP-4-dehydrorhamnose 3,5-epimerase, partial [bacterium]|nr:dTDP-4-dehydrorhamnose 3,5-epimerase [bacterium]
VDNFYNKASERGIAYNDKDLNISWPLPQEQLVLSDKDKALGTFKKWAEEFL